MAQFNADIKLNADARAVERAIDRLEKRLERLREKASSIMDGGSKGPKALLPPAELTRAQKFEKFIDNWFAGVKKLNSAFSTALMSLTLASGILDDELKLIDQQFKAVSNVNKALFLQGDTLSKLGKEAARIDKIWNNTRYTYQRFNVLAARQVELEDRRAELLRRQADAIRRQRLEQERLYEAVRRNVRRSEAGRQDSGFAAFSQEAGGAVRRRVAQDRQAQIDAINDIERLRESKALNSYNTRQRRIRYLAKLQEDLDRKLEASRDKRRSRRARAEEQAAKDAARGLENLFLGAGFPLLFGGGAGAVGGGVLGSLFGDGFGGQVFVGAIGQQIDALAQSSIEFARAFREGGDAAGALAQALGYLNPEVSALISNLQRSGQTARAAAVAQGELAKVVGAEGAKALRETGEDLDQYQRSIKQLGLQFLAAAQSASRFFQSLRGDFGRIPGLAPRVEEPDVSQAARDRENALARSNTLLEAEVQLAGISQKLDLEKYTNQLKRIANLELINENERIKIALDRGEITLAERKLLLDAARLKNDKELLRIKKLISEDNARTAASDQKAAEAEQKRIATLQAQLNTSTALLAIDKQIAAAKVDGDKAKLAELEYTRALEASELKIAEIRARRAGEAETQLQIQLEENRLEKQLLDIDTKRALERKKLQESFQATIDGLTIELGLAQAVTREEENRLKLQQKRLSLQGKGLDQNQINQILELEGRLQAAQAPIQQYMTQLQKSLNDVDAQIVRMAQTIETELGSAMSSAITGVITGTQTVEQAVSTMFANIGKAFIDMATQMIAKALILQALGVFSGGGNMGGSGYYDSMTGLGTAGPNFGLADGGPVDPNGTHLVGERGPELFVPGQSGMVVPNDIFDATRQALTSGGGTDQAFSENSEALAVANSYTRERMFERERQTMLTGAGGSTTVQTQVINNVEYATIDQVQEVANLSAK